MAKSNSSEQGLASACSLFKLLSDKTRLQIVLHLAQSECTVTGLCKDLKLPQPTVSHHLGLLRMNRLIVNKRNGKQVIYSLGSQAKCVKSGLKFSVAPYSVSLDIN